MIINLGNNSTSSASKGRIFEQISEKFLLAYDSVILPEDFPTSFLEDAGMFTEFQYWLKTVHDVSIRLINVGLEERYIFAVEFTEDENFTKLLLSL